MSNKHLTNFTILFVIAILTLFTSCDKLANGGNVELIKAIPNNVVFIAKCNNIEALDSNLTQLEYHDVLKAHTWLDKLGTNHAALEAVLSKTNNTSINFPMVASLHLSNATELNSIHYFPLKLSKKAFENLLHEHFGASKQEWLFQNTMVTEIALPELQRKVTVAYKDHILMVSPVSILVEDAIKQLNKGSGLLSDDNFQKVYNKEGNDADVNIWFKYDNFKKWASTFASNSGLKQLTPFSNFAEWSLLDVYFNEKDIFFSGITSASKNNTLNAFKTQSQCSHSKGMVLPSNTAIEAHYSSLPDSLQQWRSSSSLKNCWTKILVEPVRKSDIKNWAIVLEVEDKTNVNAQTKVAIEKVGQKLLNTDRVYSKAFDEYFIVSQNEKALTKYFTSLKSGQTLAKDANFIDLEKQMQSNGNVNFYVRTAYTKTAFDAIYNTVDAQKDFEALRGFNQLAIQFGQHNDYFSTNAILTYSPVEHNQYSNLVWSTNLDDDVIAGPQLIEMNNENFVLVQDGAYKLYLLDKQGNTVWTKQLKSELLGTAKTLNLYNDGNAQLTFNTKQNWYLVDSDAEDIVGFPLKFKDSAITGVALAKLNKKQCAFIGSSNGNVYGYEINGKPLVGWNPKAKVGKLKGEIQSINYKGKDYIAGMTTNGTTTIWNKKGNVITSKSFQNKFSSLPYVDKKASPFKLKNVKTNGELVSVNTRGSVGKFKLPVSKVTQFRMEDITGNSDPEIIVNTGSGIVVFSYTGNRLWAKKIKGELKVVSKSKNGDKAIAVIDNSKNTIKILHPKNGKVVAEPDFYVGDYSCAGQLLDNQQASLISSGQGSEVNCYRIGW